MENKNKLKEEIIAYITEFFREFPEKEKIPNVWNDPIVGFADAMDPYIQNLPRLISPSHGLPQQVMEEAKIVLVYYAPFLKEVSASGRDATSYSSPYLEQAYQKTDILFEKLNKELKEKLKEYGYRGVTDSEMNKYDEQKLISNWSFRHFAYAAGIGTFGLNNMLITRKGCCGRYNIMVTDLDVEADRHREEEYCLYKKNGSCGVCVKNCPQKALTFEGFNRSKCYAVLQKNAQMEPRIYDEKGMVIKGEICGKCVSRSPCSFWNLKS